MLKLSSKYFLISRVATGLSKRPAQKLPTTEQMVEKQHADSAEASSGQSMEGRGHYKGGRRER